MHAPAKDKLQAPPAAASAGAPHAAVVNPVRMSAQEAKARREANRKQTPERGRKTAPVKDSKDAEAGHGDKK
jgi:hypothetical protein